VSALATLLRLVVSLAVVLALMALLARYLRNRQLGGGGGLGAPRSRDLGIQVLTRQGVGRTASVTLVQVAGTVLLLGVTESSVSVLRELTDEELVPEPVEAPPGPPTTATNAALPPLPALLELLRDRTARRG